MEVGRLSVLNDSCLLAPASDLIYCLACALLASIQQLFGRTLRLSWAHQRQPQHSPSPSLETISRPRSFGASSSGDFSPTAPRLSAGAAIGMVPMLAASPGEDC